MAAVQRILPRDWDGRRLLRFLAGLALLALAFTPAGLSLPSAAAPVPAAVPVTVGLDVGAAAGPDAGAVTGPDVGVAAGPDAAAPDRAAQASGDATAARPAGWPVAVSPPAGAGRAGAPSAALPEGVSPRAHGSRGPPRA